MTTQDRTIAKDSKKRMSPDVAELLQMLNTLELRPALNKTTTANR